MSLKSIFICCLEILLVSGCTGSSKEKVEKVFNLSEIQKNTLMKVGF